MSHEPHPFNWLRFVVRFAFGAVFGGILGIYVAASAKLPSHATLIIALMPLPFGLISAFWGDRFWESFRDAGFWNLFRWW
jgi:hypothetical protein